MPPATPLLAALPEPPLSTLRVPVSLDLDFVAAKALQAIPRPLAQGVVRRTVQPVAFAPAVAVAVRHRSEMEALSLRMDGDRLVATARIGFRAGGSVEGAGVAVDLASCGEKPGEPAAAIELTVAGRLTWGPDGTFAFAAEPWSVRWLRPCELTAIHVSLEDVLNLPGVRERVQGAVDAAIRRLPEAVRVRPVAERIWREASRPLPVAPGLVLQAHPESLFTGPLRGAGRTLQTSLILLARPRVSTGETDSVRPMPPLAMREAVDPAFRVDLAGRVPLSVVDSVLSALLRGKPLESDGKPVRIERVRVYGGGDRAVVAATFSQPFEGEVFLRGIPEYDSATESVRFADLDFDLASRSFLARVAATVLHGSIRASIQKAAVLPMNRFLPALAEREVPLGEGASAKVTVARIRPLGISIDDSTLQAWVRAEGTATVSVGLR